jgi:hypothetical protein
MQTSDTPDHTHQFSKASRSAIGVLAVSLTLFLWSCQSGWSPGWNPGSGARDLAQSLLILVIISTLLQIGSQAVGKAEALLARIAENKFAIFLVAGIGFSVACSMCLLGRAPRPYAHDEFSYLLAADTFSHGRLTNPTHPLWPYFETFHIIQQPTYASKYPPAQGLILAVGQILGNPIVGAWIATGLACGALFWMLKQWMPARWAFLGSALVSLHPLLVEWGHNYWGGQVAVIGGALLIGAARQIAENPKPYHGVIAGIGISILANSRPYEGLVLTVAVAMLTFFWARTWRKVSLSGVLLSTAGPALAVLMVTAIAMAFYNYRVTGNPLTMPYQVYEATYNPVPLFQWQKIRPLPPYNHFELRQIYESEAIQFLYREARSVPGLVSLSAERLRTYAYWFFLGSVPLLGLILGAFITRADRETRSIGLGALICWIALIPECWEHDHYLAPGAGLCLLFSLMVIRRLRSLRWKGFGFGLLLTRTLAVVALICFVNLFRSTSQAHSMGWYDQRALLVEKLEEQGGHHLIVVHYSPDYEPKVEWVFNGADIDSSPIVWAHDMGDAKNADLLAYFKGRRIWLLTVGNESSTITPYPHLEEEPPSNSD